MKKKGRGKHSPSEIYASKGSEIFRPQFSRKYVVELITSETKKSKAIDIIRKNSSAGKIFVSPIIETIDIDTVEINYDYNK